MNILNSIQSISKYNQNIGIIYATSLDLLSTAIVWCEANDASTILDTNNAPVSIGGTTVSKWVNKNNTNEYFMAQNSSTFTYTNTFNTSYNAIQTQGNNAYMLYSNPASLPYLSYSVFIIANIASTSSNYGVMGIGSDNNGGDNLELVLYQGTMALWNTFGSHVSYISTFNYGTNPILCEFEKTQSTDKGYYWGNAMPNNSITSTGLVAQNYFNLFSYGGTTNYVPMVTGSNIAEVILFNNYLSDRNRQMVEGYISWKYGLQTQLPTNHPYYSSPPP